MAKHKETQVIVKYTTDDKHEQSFENMYFDIPKHINIDVSFQLMFGFQYNHKEERRLELKHHRNNMQIELNEKSIFNS